ncbi:MAG TPA: hypothetical protein VFA29_03185 [Candidatus Baltobacteraceae bacterium]|nr:hypothetical protein [Candidatus Baltobacteraceae bacterium]
MVTRAGFLSQLPILGVSSCAPAPTGGGVVRIGGVLPFDFDRGAFNAILRKPAKHRQCFGCTKLDGGDVINAMANSSIAYDDDLREGRQSIHTVAVLYHGSSIWLALNSGVWNQYLDPYLAQNADVAREIPEAKKHAGNPYLTPRKLLGAVNVRGASFFVCHNALAGLSQAIAKAVNAPADEVHRTLMTSLVPGALVVPAGVMAINACQEAGFTYIAVS